MIDHPTEWLSAYIDLELEAGERMRIEEHLLACESCQDLIADLMDMRSQVADFYGHLEAPADLEQKVLASLTRKLSASAITKTSSAAVPLVGLAAIAVLLYMYGATFFKLCSIVLQFMLTAAYVISHIAAAIPAVWGSVMVLSAAIFVISGLSLRRILRSTVQ